MAHVELVEIMKALNEPFSAGVIQWKPQAVNKAKSKALAVAYASARVYEDRLNEVCPAEWAVTFSPWGENQIICHLTIAGITRSSTGEANADDANTGTSAEQQAFKRACVKFRLGRYLYDLPTRWVEVQQQGRSYVFTDQALAQLRRGLPTSPSEPASVEPVPVGGDRRRPYSAETVRLGLRRKAAAAGGGAITSQAQAVFCARKFQEAFAPNKNAEEMYHLSLVYIWDVDSAKKLTESQAALTLVWLLGGNEPDETGDTPLGQYANAEARNVYAAALKDAEQTGAFDTTEPSGEAMREALPD